MRALVHTDAMLGRAHHACPGRGPPIRSAGCDADLAGCPGCGGLAVGHDRSVHEAANAPCSGGCDAGALAQAELAARPAGTHPRRAWTDAYDADGGVREGAMVAELMGLLDLTGWPPGMRVIV